MHGRRATDKEQPRRRLGDHPILASLGERRAVSWEDQHSQFITRYLFWALGLAYFNVGAPVARSPDFLIGVNLVHLAYVVLTTLYVWHAQRNPVSPLRWRLAMWTDIVATSFMALADVNMASPAYLVLLAVMLGNGMRYGLRSFGEAAVGSFLSVLLVLYLRFTGSIDILSVAGFFFLLFGAILVLYAYSLVARFEHLRTEMAVQGGLDPLTGLLNRRGLEERATILFRDVATGQGLLATLFADLDGFKGINDRLGHHVGDTVLRKVAELIRTTLRGSDVAARYGGDEFVILMPNTTLAQARGVAGRLQAGLREWARGENYTLTLSIGLGEAPVHGSNLGHLLARVDSAMYLNKKSTARGGIRCVDDVPA